MRMGGEPGGGDNGDGGAGDGRGTGDGADPGAAGAGSVMMGSESAVPSLLEAWALPGIAEIHPGDDLSELIVQALMALARSTPERTPADGDILVVTSKIVSKAEGRVVRAENRDDAITAETVRLVASRVTPEGTVRIVENRLGIVGAAAGVDASNTPEGTVLLLPESPDASARALCRALRERFGVHLGVIISDTLGRAWRIGQTDIAIGAAGMGVIDDLRGCLDQQGRSLAVTVPVVADEIAGLGDLVKGKASGMPVAVVRGMGRLVTAEVDTPGARTLPRTGEGDMFRLGTDEAYRIGFEAGMRAANAAGVTGTPPVAKTLGVGSGTESG